MSLLDIKTKRLPNDSVVQSCERDSVVTIIPVKQQMSYFKTDNGVKIIVELSDLKVMELFNTIKAVQNIEAEGLQLVYRTESKLS